MPHFSCNTIVKNCKIIWVVINYINYIIDHFSILINATFFL